MQASIPKGGREPETMEEQAGRKRKWPKHKWTQVMESRNLGSLPWAALNLLETPGSWQVLGNFESQNKRCGAGTEHRDGAIRLCVSFISLLDFVCVYVCICMILNV